MSSHGFRYIFDPQSLKFFDPQDSENVIRLPRKPLAVLLYLRQHPDRVVSVDEILKKVWPDTIVTRASVKDYIAKIRSAFNDDPAAPTLIETVRGQGYRLIGDVQDYTSAGPSAAPTPNADPTPDKPVVLVVSLDQYCQQNRIDAALKHAADCISSSLQIALSRFGSLNIKSHTVSGDQISRGHFSPALAQRLHRADYLLTIQITGTETRARILLRLHSTNNEQIIWGESTDVIPSDIVRSIEPFIQSTAIELEAKLRSNRWVRATRKTAAELTAHDYYIIGQHTPVECRAGNMAARRCFEKVLDLVPDHAAALAACAGTYAIDAAHNHSNNFEQNLATAHALLQRTANMHHADSRVLCTMGQVFSLYKEFELAGRFFERALKANPLNTDAMAMYGWSLAFAGATDKACHFTERALQLHPLSPGWYTWNHGITSYFDGDYSTTMLALKQFCSLRPAHPRPKRLLAVTLEKTGHHRQACRIVREIVSAESSACLATEEVQQSRMLSNAAVVDDFLMHLQSAGMPA